MPFIKSTHINKIYNSIKKTTISSYFKYKTQIGNPIGFNISLSKNLIKLKGT